MLFNSLTFLVFFAVVWALHRMPLPWGVKKLNLLLASYLFYAAWNPPFILLLWLSTVVDWWAARRIEEASTPGRRKAWLALSLTTNLGMLGAFKYGGFLLENFSHLAGLAGWNYQPPAWDVVLPVGISFYTFQTLSYTLDVYLRRAKSEPSLLNFSLFVTFFPQLVAGPIVRPTDLLPQFEKEPVASGAQIRWGLFLMTLGLFQKVVVADGLLAPAADAVFGAPGPVPALDAWLGVLAFSGQIFCDFAGYTTTAIGASLVLGFTLIENFRQPYAAIGFSDFWRRWHISLSTWLRDYLYIPLGGNRKGPARTQINLLLTMVLGGLWHGAAWTFVIWGALHGLYLVGERLLKGLFGEAAVWRTSLGRFGLGALTFVLVLVAWVFFRAKGVPAALGLLASMFGVGPDGTPALSTWLVVSAAATMALLLGIQVWLRERSVPELFTQLPGWVVALLWGGLAFTLAITQGGSDAFIYFQF